MFQSAKDFLKRAIEPALAALCLMILFQVHIALINGVLGIAHIRGNAPQIVATIDVCGKTTVVSPLLFALTGEGINKGDANCRSTARILVASPPMAPTQIYVNRRFVRNMPADFQGSWLQIPELRPGVNVVTVVGADQTAWIPHGTLSAPASWSARFYPRKPRQLEDAYFSSFQLDVGINGGKSPYKKSVVGSWAVSGTDLRRVLIVGESADEDPPGSTTDGKTWRSWMEEDRHWSIDQGTAGLTLVDVPQDVLTGYEKRDPVTRRTLQVTRDSDGRIYVSANACVPSTYPLARLAQSKALSGPELIGRLFNTQVGAFERSEILDRIPNDNVTWAYVGGQCIDLTTAYSIPDGRMLLLQSFGSEANFPMLPGDQLTLTGMDDYITITGRGPDEIDGPRKIWRGRSTLIMAENPEDLSIWGNDRPSSGNSDQSDGGTGQPGSESAKSPGTAFLRQFKTPEFLQPMLSAIAVMAPLALLLWSMRRNGTGLSPSTVRRVTAGLIALLVFVGAYPLQQALWDAFVRALLQTPFFMSFGYIFVQRMPGLDLPSPVALMVVVLVVPMVRNALSKAKPKSHWLARTSSAVITLILIGLGFYLLKADLGGMQRDLSGLTGIQASTVPLDSTEINDKPDEQLIATTAVMLGIWCLVGLMFFWVPIYWLLRSLVQRGRVWWSALAASLIVFFLPLVAVVVNFVTMVFAFSSKHFLSFGASESMFNLYMTLPVIIKAVATLASSLVLIVLVYLVLRGFGQIAQVMLTRLRARKLQLWTRPIALTAMTLVIIWTIPSPASGDQAAVSPILLVMIVFQRIAPLLGLIAAFTVLQIAGRARKPVPNDVYWICGAVFAGYLAVGHDRRQEEMGASLDPFAVLCLIAIGWICFTKLLLRPASVPNTAPTSQIGAKLIAYRDKMRVLDARRKSAEGDYIGGKLTATNLANEIKSISARQRAAATALGTDPVKAKIQILDAGPYAAPIRNGWLGLGAGFAVAVILLIFTPLGNRGPLADAGAPLWLTLTQSVLNDSGFGLIPTGSEEPRILVLLSQLFNATAYWAIVGFIFGFAFRRIRGTDGAAKALIFGAGISGLYLLKQALMRTDGIDSSQTAIRLVEIFVLLLTLGVFVFDRKSLKSQRLGLNDLPTIYGVDTFIGYASVAGVLATLQPIMQFFSWLFRRN
jgi:hypothetical protein